MTSRSSSEAQAASILVFGRFAAMFAEAATPFVIVRLLGKADVGAFSGLMLIYTTLSVIFTAGFPAAVLYYLANRAPEQRKALVARMTGTVLALGAIVGALTLLIGLVGDDVLAAFGRWFSGDEPPPATAEDAAVSLAYLKSFALFALLDTPARVFPNLLIAEQRPRGAALFGVFRAVGMTAGTLVPAAMGGDVADMVWGLTVFAALQALYMIKVTAGLYPHLPKVAAEVPAREMLRFSFPLGITEVVNNLNAAVDRYLILFFMNAAAFAEYRTGAWQLPLTTIAYSVGHVYLPRMVERLQAGHAREVVDLWRTTTLKTSLIVVPITMIFLVSAEDFVRLAFTEDYLGATPVFALYMLVTMARVAPFGAVILAAGKSQLVLRAAAFTLVTSTLLSLPLTLWLGFVGPALGTALAFGPTVAVYCYYISKSVGVPFTHTFPLLGWLRVVAIAALAAAPVVLLDLAVDLHPGLRFALTAVTLLPLFVLLAFKTKTMGPDDLRFVLGFLKLDFLKKKPKT